MGDPATAEAAGFPYEQAATGGRRARNAGGRPAARQGLRA